MRGEEGVTEHEPGMSCVLQEKLGDPLMGTHMSASSPTAVSAALLGKKGHRAQDWCDHHSSCRHPASVEKLWPSRRSQCELPQQRKVDDIACGGTYGASSAPGSGMLKLVAARKPWLK